MYDKKLEDAKKRLIDGRSKRLKRRQKSNENEPELLISGQLDEVELKRLEKEDNEHE